MTDLIDRLWAALESRYRVEREIGSGGMATVYLAEDLKHHRQVAIKVLSPDLTAPLGTQRFLREIDTVARLSHPHVVPLYDSGEAGGLFYFVMPFVEGESLRARLLREKQLPVHEAVQIAREVANALAYAHERGVIHRDIKPGNVLLSSGEAVVADFGIARALDAASDTRLTGTGITSGSPAYMSPEQWDGEDVDHRSDIHSLGAVLYEMLAGSPPFTGPSSHVIRVRQGAGPPPDITTVRETVPEALEQVVFQALNRVPADRFATAEAFAEALLPYATTGTQVAGPPAVPTRTRWPFRLTTAAIPVALLAVFLVVRQGAGIDFQERDWILIADVENNTEDEVFDRTLLHAITVAIDQSQYVNVFPRNRVKEVLERMQREPSTPIDEAVALEIAQREPIKAVLSVAISALGNQHVLTTHLIDPSNGVAVASHREEANGQDQVLEALDGLARRVRSDLGESLAQIQERGVALPRATTQSLDALKLYVDGQEAWSGNRAEEARSLWIRAVALDSTFAWAQASLGLAIQWLEGRDSAQPQFQRALSLLDRVTEKERLWITGLVSDGEDAMRAYQAYVQLYPDDRDGWYNLGNVLRGNRRFEEAMAAYERSIAIDSMQSWSFVNLGVGYDDLGRFDEAAAAFDRALALDPGLGPSWRGDVNRIPGFVMAKVGDTVRAREHFELLLPLEPEGRSNGLRSLGLLEMYRGAHARGIDLLEEAVVLNQQTSSSLSEFRNRMYMAQAFRTKGMTSAFAAQLAAGESLLEENHFTPFWAMLLARQLVAGSAADRAQRMVDTWIQDGAESGGDRWLVELIRGEVALAQDRDADAVASFETANQLNRTGITLDALARGYEASGALAEAAEAYEELIRLMPLGLEPQEAWALAHYRLGLVYDELGDGTRSREYLRRFVDVWGSGDDDLEGLADARERLAGPG